MDGKLATGLCITPVPGQPIRFNGQAYIRIGSSTPLLSKYIEMERRIWQTASGLPFEHRIAMAGVPLADLWKWLSHASLVHFRPTDSETDLQAWLLENACIVSGQEKEVDITHLGALLFALDLRRYPALAHKALRIIAYKGTSKMSGMAFSLDSLPEFGQGYAVGFVHWLQQMNAQAGLVENIGHKGLRELVGPYPSDLLRELLANALLHQNLDEKGIQPRVEIFTDRVVFTNPGVPLLDPNRFVDGEQRRNPIMADRFRQLRMAEETGKGWDLIVYECEKHFLAPPLIEPDALATRIVVRQQLPFAALSLQDRLRGCVQHAALAWETKHQPITNASLRARFKTEDAPSVSRVLRAALDKGLIRDTDPDSGTRNKAYVPMWASRTLDF